MFDWIADAGGTRPPVELGLRNADEVSTPSGGCAQPYPDGSRPANAGSELRELACRRGGGGIGGLLPTEFGAAREPRHAETWPAQSASRAQPCLRRCVGPHGKALSSFGDPAPPLLDELGKQAKQAEQAFNAAVQEAMRRWVTPDPSLPSHEASVKQLALSIFVAFVQVS